VLPTSSPSVVSRPLSRPTDQLIVRGQSPGSAYDPGPGGYPRGPQPVSGAPAGGYTPLNYGAPQTTSQPYAPPPPQYAAPQPNQPYAPAPYNGNPPFVQPTPNYAYQPQVGAGPASALPP